ncbi:hypothetical protein OG763_14545 [Streptomyces sp. NBC_01230]|uniref:hypothetical protein n=1 Tax=Streptomyces sp. NBC_01230 TaxID=2903784 RepID=UPI002E12D4D1|nr:hypothetical protein OG763_14545 [Streptomyces sp. NBC_01230]
MDAAIAGLVGALGGGFLGAAGAWGAGLIAFRGARYQADKQAAADREQWLRQIRRDTYSAFIAEAEKMSKHFLAAMEARRIDRGEDGMERVVELRAAAMRDLEEFQRAQATLELEAPLDVIDFARDLARPLSDLIKAPIWSRSSSPIRHSELDWARYTAYRQSITELRDRCRTSLQN